MVFRKLFLLSAILGVMSSILFAYDTYIQKNTVVCPDDFKNSEEKVAAFKYWIDNEFEPKSQETFFSDLQKAREEFYIEHGCTKALERLKKYNSGELDEETYQTLETIIKEQINEKNDNF